MVTKSEDPLDPGDSVAILRGPVAADSDQPGPSIPVEILSYAPRRPDNIIDVIESREGRWSRTSARSVLPAVRARASGRGREPADCRPVRTPWLRTHGSVETPAQGLRDTSFRARSRPPAPSVCLDVKAPDAGRPPTCRSRA